MTQTFLRSVNLRDDIANPARLAHYHPTSRSLPVARAVLSGKATMVIAAYGSGKSLAAGIGALAVSNDAADRRLMRDLADRMAIVDVDFATEYAEHVALALPGRVAVLSGYVRDLPSALSAALGLGPADGIDDVLRAASRIKGADRIAIVWDEFGRHLEGLVKDGRSLELDDVQRLAEWASRASSPSASLTVLMHQNLLAYAGSLNQTTRHEWKKIEGRFDQIRFVEDSRELYGLVAKVVSDRKAAAGIPHKPKERFLLSREVIGQGWFDGMADEDAISDLMVRAMPLSAAALQVLPRLVARVGQNERSLFAFIEGIGLAGEVGMEEVYLAFSEAMRSDVGVGGMHRRWIEAESARSKAAPGIEREVIAAAFLLQIGAHGERRHLPMPALRLAVRCKGFSPDETEAAIEALIARKLILYRKLTDDVSVWHGADVDIASRLRDERMRRVGGFDLFAFLDAQHPAPFLRPVRHNAEFGTTRYLAGSYATVATLPSIPENPAPGTWGRIVYVICNSGDEIREARAFAASASLARTIVVVPSEPIPVLDASLEVDALVSLRRDESLLSEDPLVGQEIDELLTVARRHLSVVMHRLTTDRPTGAAWLTAGRDLGVTPELPAGVAVSALMDEWFPLTPRIANDQMMRGTLSRQMSTARVRTITRILEHSAQPGLGYSDDTSPEASIYRTVLARTGIHLERDGQGAFAEPAEVTDPGLREAWARIRAFFTVPGRRSLSDIVEALSSSPIGLPAGVIPVLVMAGYRAFGRAVSIWTDGAYVPDLLGFDSARLFLEPARHEFDVHTDDAATLAYLAEVAHLFSNRRPGPHDERVRFAQEAIRVWRSGIAEGAFRSRRMTDAARLFLRRLNTAASPSEFLLDTLPSNLGGDHASVLRALEDARNVIDGLVDGYLRDAVDVTCEVLGMPGGGEGISGIAAWVACLDVQGLMRRDDLKITDKAVLRTARDTLGGKQTPEMLARAVSSVLLQRGIEKWQDDTREHLRKELRECRHRIESASLDVLDPPESLEPIIEARIRHLQDQLGRIREARKGTGR